MNDQIGEIYRWAGKRWRVTKLRYGAEGGTQVLIQNVERPKNTAALPVGQFRAETRERPQGATPKNSGGTP
jgi:hypothetical protein